MRTSRTSFPPAIEDASTRVDGMFEDGASAPTDEPFGAAVGQAVAVESVQQQLVKLGGGDRFGDVLEESEGHQRVHGCGLFSAGPL